MIFSLGSLKADKKKSLQYMDVSRIKAFQESSGEVSSRKNSGLRPVHIDSCFGGLAIYK